MSESQLADKLESNFSSLSGCLRRNAQIAEFLESVSLVGSSILGLFANKSLSEIASDALKVGTFSDVSCNVILTHSKKLNCHDLLAYLDKANPEGFSTIPPDFFNPIAKQFTRGQSIDNFSKLLRTLFRIYGLHHSFIRNFFSVSRDYEESKTLLKYLRAWDYSRFNFTYEMVATKVFLCMLERLSISALHDDMLVALREQPALVPQQSSPEMVTLFNKTIFNALMALISKKDLQRTQQFLAVLVQPSYCLSLISINRLLDGVNKHMVSQEIVDLLFQTVSANGHQPNVITYNCYIESLCLLGKMDQALLVLDAIKKDGLEPDSYTYANLMKGLKGLDPLTLHRVHQQMLRSFLDSTCRDRINLNSLMDQCINSNDDSTALEIFDELKSGRMGFEADNVAFNIFMKLLIRNKDVAGCSALLADYKRRGFRPNLSTFNSLLNMLLKQGHAEELMPFFKAMPGLGMTPDSFTFSILLNGAKLFKFRHEDTRQILQTVRDSMEANTQKIDEVVFNSILEILFANDLLDQFDYFYSQMKKQNIPESSFTFSLILKKLSRGEDFEKIKELFDEILAKKIKISDFNYGFILDFFAKNQRMDQALVIFHKLREHKVELSSIIFTTMIKGFINAGDLKTAMQIFKEVKHAVDQPGMIITYNCALDVLILENCLEEAVALFSEIEARFKADLISYSTLVKGYCKAGQRPKAFALITTMMDAKVEYDVSIINLFLENCAANDDNKLGVSCFEAFHKRRTVFNDITMGIMVKIYGASFKLKSAFDLLGLMEQYQLRPSLIFFTNLIHVSFFNKKPLKAELAATLMKKEKIRGDKLMYSKLIEGLLRFKQTERVLQYVQAAIDDSCTLKQELIDQLFEIFEDEPEACQLIERVKYAAKNGNAELKKEKLKNTYHQANTQFFKNQIWQKNREKQEADQKDGEGPAQKAGPENPGRGAFGVTKKQGDKAPENSNHKNNPFHNQRQTPGNPKQPLILHNFRTNKKGE